MQMKINVVKTPNFDPSKIRAALWEAVKLVEAEAKSISPVDTGNMKNSIYSEVDGSIGKVISPAEYSSYVEYGTVRSQAQPFMRPALFGHKNDIKNLFLEAFRG